LCWVLGNTTKAVQYWDRIDDNAYHDVAFVGADDVAFVGADDVAFVGATRVYKRVISGFRVQGFRVER